MNNDYDESLLEKELREILLKRNDIASFFFADYDLATHERTGTLNRNVQVTLPDKLRSVQLWIEGRSLIATIFGKTQSFTDPLYVSAPEKFSFHFASKKSKSLEVKVAPELERRVIHISFESPEIRNPHLPNVKTFDEKLEKLGQLLDLVERKISTEFPATFSENVEKIKTDILKKLPTLKHPTYPLVIEVGLAFCYPTVDFPSKSFSAFVFPGIKFKREQMEESAGGLIVMWKERLPDDKILSELLLRVSLWAAMKTARDLLVHVERQTRIAEGNRLTAGFTHDLKNAFMPLNRIVKNIDDALKLQSQLGDNSWIEEWAKKQFPVDLLGTFRKIWSVRSLLRERVSSIHYSVLWLHKATSALTKEVQSQQRTFQNFELLETLWKTAFANAVLTFFLESGASRAEYVENSSVASHKYFVPILLLESGIFVPTGFENIPFEKQMDFYSFQEMSSLIDQVSDLPQQFFGKLRKKTELDILSWLVPSEELYELSSDEFRKKMDEDILPLQHIFHELFYNALVYSNNLRFVDDKLPPLVIVKSVYEKDVAIEISSLGEKLKASTVLNNNSFGFQSVHLMIKALFKNLVFVCEERSFNRHFTYKNGWNGVRIIIGQNHS